MGRSNLRSRVLTLKFGPDMYRLSRIVFSILVLTTVISCADADPSTGLVAAQSDAGSSDDASSVKINVFIEKDTLSPVPFENCTHNGETFALGDLMGNFVFGGDKPGAVVLTQVSYRRQIKELENPFATTVNPAEGKFGIVCGNTPMTFLFRIADESQYGPQPDEINVFLTATGTWPRLKHRFEHLNGDQLAEGGEVDDRISIRLTKSKPAGERVRITQEF